MFVSQVFACSVGLARCRQQGTGEGRFLDFQLPYLEFIMNWRPFLRFQQIV